VRLVLSGYAPLEQWGSAGRGLEVNLALLIRVRIKIGTTRLELVEAERTCVPTVERDLHGCAVRGGYEPVEAGAHPREDRHRRSLPSAFSNR
jgi:hypothetical protein